MRESAIESYLVKRCTAYELRKVKFIARNGAPDRVLMAPGGRIVWIEVKAEGLGAKFPSNAHERAQHREHERLRAMGQRVVVIDSLAGVDGLLEGL